MDSDRTTTDKDEMGQPTVRQRQIRLPDIKVSFDEVVVELGGDLLWVKELVLHRVAELHGACVGEGVHPCIRP